MSIKLEEVNWGIIGAGDVCEVKSGPAMNKIKHSKLVAVMRRNGAKQKIMLSVTTLINGMTMPTS